MVNMGPPLGAAPANEPNKVPSTPSASSLHSSLSPRALRVFGAEHREGKGDRSYSLTSGELYFYEESDLGGPEGRAGLTGAFVSILRPGREE